MENFNIKKFFSLDRIGFIKLLAFGFKLLVIIAIIVLAFSIFRFFAPKKPKETYIDKAEKVTIYQNNRRSGFTTGLFGGLHNSGDEYFIGGQVSKEW